MSKPVNRGKKKRVRVQDNVENSSQILRQIHASGEVSNENINKLFMIWKPTCQGCRVNCKENPNCFCALIPPPNGVRKSGLWQKMSDILQCLGPEPSPGLRPSDDCPAGLTNLGATCYANSILQCLYMNKSFRDGVFSVEPDVLKQQPVLDQLVRLFAQLCASKLSIIDSAPIVETLELNDGVQQDSHEFLTLFLSLLERCLTQSKVLKARTIIQDLFRGSVSNVTVCSKCQKYSESSSKIEDFYELELNIQGLETLDDSLDDYLSVEHLQGDNQYFCESCQQRVDASRSIMLRNLPEVLNFQLKRCIFNPKTTKKKKITSSFSFPGVIDMQKRLSEASSSSSWVYDLSAILLHKGNNVNTGHYVAHIKDEKTGIWWEFDDEIVKKLSTHPFEVGTSNASGSSSNQANENANQNKKVVEQIKEHESNGNPMVYSSNDAYMLMYTRRYEQRGNVQDIIDSGFPTHLLEDMKVFNAAYIEMVKDYESKKEVMVQHVQERREEVRTILSKAAVQSSEDLYFWISSEWLRQWSDTIDPPMLDNTPILCSHGKVPHSKISSIKRLSSEAWNALVSKHNGGPILTNSDYCTKCLLDGAQTLISAESFRNQRILMKDLSGLVLSGQCVDGKYYISRLWLQQWAKKKNLDFPSDADIGPTTAITCPHGLLIPEKAPGAKRLLVPETLWLFFFEVENTLKNGESVGCKAFTLDSDECPQCNDQFSEVASLEDSQRLLKIRQRQTHEQLSSGKKNSLSLQSKYYLLPTSWLNTWRTYVNSNGKNTLEPEKLNVIMNTLKCEKHNLLALRPPQLELKRGIISQKSSTIDGLSIISESDWNSFCEEWNCERENGIIMIIEPPSVFSTEDSSKEGIINLIVKTTPTVCETCLKEKESQELIKKLNYNDEMICVTLVHGNEPPQSILDTPESNLDYDRRGSKRSRKTRDLKTVSFKVSGSTSIYHLKMMIWESFGVVKENQILRKGARLIDCESATLADSNIFPGDKLWVQDSEIHENRDIADELGEGKMSTQSHEEGFRGTILTADNLN